MIEYGRKHKSKSYITKSVIFFSISQIFLSGLLVLKGRSCFYANVAENDASLRRVKVFLKIVGGCVAYFEEMWQETSQQDGIDKQRLQRFVNFFSGVPVKPIVSTDLNGATIVITLPEDITSKAASLMESIRQYLEKKIPNLDEKFYLTPSDALHATVLTPEMLHQGLLSENAFSVNTIAVIKSLAKAKKSFTMRIGAVNLTGNGVIILECYPENDTVFELRDNLRQALPFVSQRRHKQEVVHITLGRFLKQLSEEEFREVVDIISGFRNFEVGSFEVNELLYVHINAFGLERRDKNRDIIIPLGE